MAGNAGRDRDHTGNADSLRAGDNVIEFIREIGKIEMAMAVYQHGGHFLGDGAALVSGST